MLLVCRLIALPKYRRNAQAAAEAEAAGLGHVQPPAWVLDCPIEQQLFQSRGLVCHAAFYQGLFTQWTKVLRRLRKAAEVRTHRMDDSDHSVTFL
jgi:hypothetical protein